MPCVSTAVGGVSEVVGDTGELTPFGDPVALAKAALRLLTDGDLHRQRATAARERAVANFATESILARYLELYERTLR